MRSILPANMTAYTNSIYQFRTNMLLSLQADRSFGQYDA